MKADGDRATMQSVEHRKTTRRLETVSVTWVCRFVRGIVAQMFVRGACSSSSYDTRGEGEPMLANRVVAVIVAKATWCEE